jgi:hypothetical protein
VIEDRDEIRLPECTSGLFEVAFVSYGRRLPLYVGFAALAFILQLAISLAAPKLVPTEGLREGLIDGANFVIDAFLCGLVTIGIVADLRARTRSADGRAILGDAIARWWIVALLIVVVNLLFSSMLQDVLTSGDPTLLALSPVFLVFLGALSIATVIAAVDRTTNEALLPIVSIGRSLQVSLPFPNLGRLAIYSALLAIPTIVSLILAHELHVRHIPYAEFWAWIPIDVITVGPLQALATIFYLDFVRRLAARPQP